MTEMLPKMRKGRKGQRWSADIGENEIGFKFNMNNLAGAIGLCQLEHVDKTYGHRRNADIYNKIFSGSDSIACGTGKLGFVQLLGLHLSFDQYGGQARFAG